MCFSAQIEQKYRKLMRDFGATVDYAQAERLFLRRLTEKDIKITRGFEANFDDPRNPEERRIKDLIDQHRAAEATKIEKDLFTQKTRLVGAERKIKECEAAIKSPTKKTIEDQRIATDKIATLSRRLSDLRRTEPKDRDDRIFPFNYAPIILKRDGETVISLARYHCRQNGKPASIDREMDGLYNARRDNVERFWRREFGKTHALLVVDSFFENVDRNGKNAVLHFKPQTGQQMLVACVYSQWSDPEGKAADLLSFAAITDLPPPEIAAAGHDRCIINLRPENVDRWLAPEGRDTEELQAILSDRQQPFYEHEELAA